MLFAIRSLQIPFRWVPLSDIEQWNVVDIGVYPSLVVKFFDIFSLFKIIVFLILFSVSYLMRPHKELSAHRMRNDKSQEGISFSSVGSEGYFVLI